MKVVGMTSGDGDNLHNIHRQEQRGTLDVELAAVLSDRDAPALDWAADRGVSAEKIGLDGDSKEEHEERLAEAVRSYEGELVVLDGYMPILSPYFVEEFRDRVLNVHPSLLPSFRSTDPWGDALDAGVEVTGCTVHVVTEEIGLGPIVTQEPVRVRPDDDRESLRQRVRRAEYRAYARALRWFAMDSVVVEDGRVVRPSDEGMPSSWLESLEKATDLRYGENPHQEAAFYRDPAFRGAAVTNARKLGGKELSYNNTNDADAALSAVREFQRPAAVVVKHTNPCGAATADTLADAYRRALETDEMSAFGGIVALNRECDVETASQITDSFKEVVVAPGYSEEAVEELRGKEDLRVLATGGLGGERDEWSTKRVEGGLLVQDRDDLVVGREDLEYPTEAEPSEEQVESLLFAYTVVKHVKSNAIVLARGTETVGVGAGQMSRVDAVRIACDKAVKPVEGSVLASDAFFPFRDNIDLAAERGVEAVIQPGGSVNDDEVVEACDEHGLAMAFTGSRCFRH